MSEPLTHYQVSFTSRQAVALFVFVLVALAGAYFLGIATGMAGRPGSEVAQKAATAPSPPPAATSAPERPWARGSPLAPTPSGAKAEPRPPAPAAAAREPSSSGSIQFFEDRPEEATPAATTTEKAPREAAPASGGFSVQVLSTTSQSEAESHRRRLSARGYHSTVSTGSSPAGTALYRVRIGPYSSREEAARAAEELARKEKVKPWIVPPGQ